MSDKRYDSFVWERCVTWLVILIGSVAFWIWFIYALIKFAMRFI